LCAEATTVKPARRLCVKAKRSSRARQIGAATSDKRHQSRSTRPDLDRIDVLVHGLQFASWCCPDVDLEVMASPGPRVPCLGMALRQSCFGRPGMVVCVGAWPK
jgi:hypothetical protein